MSGGRERGIMVWDVRETLLRERLAQLDQELAQLHAIQEPPTRKQVERVGALEAERDGVRAQIAQLGPSSRAKMG